MTTYVDVTAWTPWCCECDWQFADCRTEADAIQRAEQHETECAGGIR